MFSVPAIKIPRFRPAEPWLRQVMPKSLFGRSLLIVLLPLLILQAVLAYVFYERHWDTVTRWPATGIAGEVSLLVRLLDEAETEEERRRALDLARAHFGFAVSLEPGGRLETSGLAPRSRLDATLQENFAREVDRPFAVDTRSVELPSRIVIYVEIEDGLLRILAPRKRVDSTTTRVFMLWMVGLSLLLIVIAIYFLTRQLRPIRRLAVAADSFGKGRDVGEFRLEGASEIRQAGAAFNLMRKRILRHIAQRTEMLAAVSHDLRTPLTRMKLELEMLAGGNPQPGDLDELRTDVAEMSRIVDGYLSFARGEGQEAIVPTDLGDLLGEIADRAGNGEVAVAIELEKPITIPLRPTAFRRCISNLVENALRYGTKVRLRATADRGHVWIAVDDNGPGIAKDRREAVFKPFYRIDPSRSPGTGGIGLGLTIARDIVLSQGGEIELNESPLGGLRVLIRLPR